VGLILGELLLHTPVLPGENESEEVQLIIALLGTPPSEKLWPRFRNMPLRDEYRLPPANEALENGKMTLKMRFREYSDATRGLMRRCLEWDPEERCSAKGALQHAYFKEEPRGYSTMVCYAHCSSRSCFVTYFPGGTQCERESVTLSV